MANRRGNWAALSARLDLDSRLDLAGLRQARLRRVALARMRARGLATYDEYLRLLASEPGELAALVGRLRSDLYRTGPTQALLWRAPARLWLEALPVAAVLVEAVPATGGLRLLACNRAARDLLGTPDALLQAKGRQHRWLFPNLAPCADEDMPLQRAIWQRASTRSQTLLLCDGAGRLQPLAISARRVPGRGLARAIATLQPGEAWATGEATGELLARFNESQTVASRYRRLFAESAAALLLTRPDGTVEDASGQALALLGRVGGVAGMPLAACLAEECHPALAQALQELSDSGEAALQLRPRSRPGRVLAAHARRLDEGGVALVQWALYDVTEQVEGEQHRKALVDLMLHDLRSPLATVLLGVETAQAALSPESPARATRALAAARTALRRLGRLVDSLLDISQLEAGDLGLRPTEVHLGELLAEVAAEAELSIASHKLSLDLQAAPDLPVISADRDMLFRAVCNLLDNAIRVSPAGGHIRLRAVPERGGVAISVSDEGPGIPPELLPNIFDRLAGLRLPHAPRGYGLALAFCKLAAEAHGGSARVESAPGSNTFTLWLPARS